MPFLGISIFILLILALDGIYSKVDFIILIVVYLVYLSFLSFDKSKSYPDTKTNFSRKEIILKLCFGLIRFQMDEIVAAFTQPPIAAGLQAKNSSP